MLSRVELCRMVCTHPSAVVTQFPILQPTGLDKFSTCSVFNYSTKSVVNYKLRIQYTAPTRLDSTVESRRRRRCVLGIAFAQQRRSVEIDGDEWSINIINTDWRGLSRLRCRTAGHTDDDWVREQQTTTDTLTDTYEYSRIQAVVLYNYVTSRHRSTISPIIILIFATLPPSLRQ